VTQDRSNSYGNFRFCVNLFLVPVLLTDLSAYASLELSWNVLLRSHVELLDRLTHEELDLEVNNCLCRGSFNKRFGRQSFSADLLTEDKFKLFIAWNKMRVFVYVHRLEITGLIVPGPQQPAVILMLHGITGRFISFLQTCSSILKFQKMRK